MNETFKVHALCSPDLGCIGPHLSPPRIFFALGVSLFLFSHDRCTPFDYRCSVSKASTCKLHLFPLKGSFNACTDTIVLSFSMTSFKLVPYIWHCVFYVHQTKSLKYMYITKLSHTTIRPNQMMNFFYVHSYHMIIEQFKAMSHVMDIMCYVITCIEVTSFQYHTFLFIDIYPTSISDMDHYAHLL